jgi:hypothetical protein
MPSIEITETDKQKVDALIEYLKLFIFSLPVDARMVFAIEIIKLLQPEIDELKRWAQK